MLNLPPWPNHLPLRPWQRAMLSAALKYLENPQHKDFFAAVCPGAGKTIGALQVFWWLLDRGDVSRLIVVVHTDHLRAQWVTTAEEIGFRAITDLPASNRAWPEQARVLVLTYQQIERDPEAVRRLVTDSYRTAVAFDEIHHAGDGAAWAEAIKLAFSKAKARLHLTGTPFRNDGRAIPYARYDKRYHRLAVDFQMTYEEALREGEYVIPAYFHTYGLRGKAKRGDEAFAVSFEDEVSAANAAVYLNMAIESKAWLTTVIADAHARLGQVREEQMGNAGGLIVAKDQAHARYLVDLVTKVTGEEPALAISDEPESSARITAFRESAAPWLVAVKMVSEGVDIPRLRVGVYATNVRSDLFLWQWVGRFIRFVRGVEGSQAAHLFIPAHPDLLAYAGEIRDQRLHVLPPPKPARAQRENGPAPEPSGVPVEVIEAHAVAERVIAGADEFTLDEILEARRYKDAAGLWHISDVDAAKMLRAFRAGEPTHP